MIIYEYDPTTGKLSMPAQDQLPFMRNGPDIVSGISACFSPHPDANGLLGLLQRSEVEYLASFGEQFRKLEPMQHYCYPFGPRSVDRKEMYAALAIELAALALRSNHWPVIRACRILPNLLPLGEFPPNYEGVAIVVNAIPLFSNPSFSFILRDLHRI